ncbi:hypothetical protein LguiB_000599 [Lonicera macranthoides]
MGLSLQGKQLMYRLLHRDTKNRLGSCEGANEIEKHPFFRGLNWALVRCMVGQKNLKPHLAFGVWPHLNKNPSSATDSHLYMEAIELA